MRAAVIVAFTLAAGVLLLLQPSDAGAQPEVSFMFPEDGAVLAEPPPIIQMCFASPVNIRDLDKGGDFRFSVLKPDGSGLGLRIVFQRDGLGVNVLPGLPDDPPQGEWTYEWRVTDPDTLEPTMGTIHYTVSPAGSPVPELEEPLPHCLSDGSPSPPGSTATQSPSDTPSPTQSAGEDDSDDDQDILLLTLIITGAFLGAAVAGLGLYFVRRRSGRLHLPPPGEGRGEGEQH